LLQTATTQLVALLPSPYRQLEERQQLQLLPPLLYRSLMGPSEAAAAVIPAAPVRLHLAETHYFVQRRTYVKLAGCAIAAAALAASVQKGAKM